MSLLVPPRRHDAEWMDRTDNTAEVLRPALADLARVNRLLGGRRALLGALRPYLADVPSGGTFDLLDIGTGGADLPAAVVRAARRAGRRVRIVAVDVDPVVSRLAEEGCRRIPEVTVLRADARRLPFRAGSFDVVTASLFLHHFRHDDVVALLRGFRGLARRAVVVNDLERSLVPWALFSIASRLTLRHPMTRNDGPLSILRGFTAEELHAAAAEAGAPGACVANRFPYRLVLSMPAAEPPA